MLSGLTCGIYFSFWGAKIINSAIGTLPSSSSTSIQYGKPNIPCKIHLWSVLYIYPPGALLTVHRGDIYATFFRPLPLGKNWKGAIATLLRPKAIRLFFAGNECRVYLTTHFFTQRLTISGERKESLEMLNLNSKS